ncbi:MAG: hypothetical protein LUD52_01755, partial [Opitutae bacterium]|nr:hypothetical protein [Opitutae bacterium]
SRTNPCDNNRGSLPPPPSQILTTNPNPHHQPKFPPPTRVLPAGFAKNFCATEPCGIVAGVPEQ